MKIFFRNLMIAVSVTAFGNGTSFSQCGKMKPIVKKCIPELAPFEYDAYAQKSIVFGKKVKKEVVEFSVYSGEEYKLVFCKTAMPQEVGITIYDRHPVNKDKKIIYFDESEKKSQYTCSFKPEKSGSYFIEYEIPAATAPNQKGCFVVLIGIKDL